MLAAYALGICVGSHYQDIPIQRDCIRLLTSKFQCFVIRVHL